MADKLVHVRSSGFTVLPNTPARDPRLSLSAKGLFWVMSSLPDDWQFTINGLAAVAGNGHGTGRDAISAGLKMLEDAGYLLREQRHDENGKFVGNTYVLYDESTSPFTGFPSTDKPFTGFPSTDKPFTGFPSTDKPLTENPSPDPTKYRYTNIPPIIPQGGCSRRRKEPREKPDWKPERFEGLWEYYPHKKRGNRQKAINAWDKLKPNDELISIMAHGLKKLLETIWADVGTPHVSTFLNQRRWEDAANVDDGGAQVGTAETISMRKGDYEL